MSTDFFKLLAETVLMCLMPYSLSEVLERSTDNTGKCAIIYCLLTVLVLTRIAYVL